MASSYLEDAFLFWLRQTEGIPNWIAEYRFHPDRQWRFDFAWPLEKVAVEIEGLLFDGKARHQTVSGFLGDAEKYEAALVCRLESLSSSRSLGCGRGAIDLAI